MTDPSTAMLLAHPEHRPVWAEHLCHPDTCDTREALHRVAEEDRPGDTLILPASGDVITLDENGGKQATVLACRALPSFDASQREVDLTYLHDGRAITECLPAQQVCVRERLVGRVPDREQPLLHALLSTHQEARQARQQVTALGHAVRNAAAACGASGEIDEALASFGLAPRTYDVNGTIHLTLSLDVIAHEVPGHQRLADRPLDLLADALCKEIPDGWRTEGWTVRHAEVVTHDLMDEGD